MREYSVILMPEPGGAYTVVVPALEGCVTFGHNLTEALAMAEDAIECHLMSLRKHGKNAPPDVEVVPVELEGRTEAFVRRIAVKEPAVA